MSQHNVMQKPIYSDPEIEKTCSGFQISELFEAQRKSWIALKELQKRIVPGVNEVQGIALARQVLQEMGAERSWHTPIVRIGSNTARPHTAAADEQSIYRNGDIFYIDIAPTWRGSDGNEYEGDVGDTFASSGNPQHLKCANVARELFKLGCEYWRNSNVTGNELYGYLELEAEKRGYEMVPEDDGHRIGDFPHKLVFSGGLAETTFHPTTGLWVLEIHVRDPQSQFGAYFEDILT